MSDDSIFSLYFITSLLRTFTSLGITFDGIALGAEFPVVLYQVKCFMQIWFDFICIIADLLGSIIVYSEQ